MLHGVALERPIRRVEIEMETEKQRLGFVENRDGNAGAIAFAMQSRSQYRKAVLTSRKRGFTKPSYDAADKSGCYAPVFPLGTTTAQINDEPRRLHARYPLCIVGPVSHAPDMGLLSLGEE